MSSSTVTPVLCCRRPLRRQKGDPCPSTHPTCPQHSVTSESLRQRPPAAESIPKTPPSSHPVTGELNINTHQKLGSFYWSLSLFLILHRIISFIGNRRKKPKFSKPHAAERTTLIAFIFKHRFPSQPQMMPLQSDHSCMYVWLFADKQPDSSTCATCITHTEALAEAGQHMLITGLHYNRSNILFPIQGFKINGNNSLFGYRSMYFCISN